MTTRTNHHDDALDLLASLMDLATTARAEGWTVNLAIESGGDAERLTFSAAMATRQETK